MTKRQAKKNLKKLIESIKNKEIVCASFNPFNYHHYEQCYYENKDEFNNNLLGYLNSALRWKLTHVNISVDDKWRQTYVRGYKDNNYLSICLTLTTN